MIRKVIIGSKQQINDALENSEDSENLNTSFIERLNLTIRRNVAYLNRKTPAHARRPERLFGQLEVQRCYYNFMRPHMILKFGSETYTPAMMANISNHKVTWREVLSLWLIEVLRILIYSQNCSGKSLNTAA